MRFLDPATWFLTAIQVGEASETTLTAGLEHLTRGGLERAKEVDGVVASANSSLSRSVGVDGGETVQPSKSTKVLSFMHCICVTNFFAYLALSKRRQTVLTTKREATQRFVGVSLWSPLLVQGMLLRIDQRTQGT